MSVHSMEATVLCFAPFCVLGREYLLAPPPPLCASLVKTWVRLPETERLSGYDNSSSNSRERELVERTNS
jgi:hypothetical protein